MRIPRKLKKKIPKDIPYCYEPDCEKNKKETGFTYWVKPCPFYSRDWCSLVKGEVMDQVKICGCKMGY